MPKNMTLKQEKKLHLRAQKIFKEANRFLVTNFRFVSCVFIINMIYMLVFKAIIGGISNPLSILWIISYYIFWCSFYRYYYHLKPYILSKTIFGSLNPSVKALVILFSLTITIALIPMIPFFLGFNDLYINIYENYLQKLSQISDNSAEPADIATILTIYGLMALASPTLICKPYLAWISSLRGMNSSFKKVANRAGGNYWQFVIISAVLLYVEAFGNQLDKIMQCQNWLQYTISTTVFVYTNIVFAKIYDFFYIKH
ncbi:MAG: hypothetical protein IJ525_03855 [Alphaproteobacteria bacterium]|nr:hypothetical protein [Alphaproteobacteria bacterium]